MPINITSVVVETLVCRRSPYTPVDPVTSALHALADYFREVDGIAAAEVGWPERPDDLDLSAGAVATFTFADETRRPIPPDSIADTSPQLYRTGELSIDVQLDLWAAYRAQREDGARAVEAALNNALPWRHGLLLLSRGYYSRPLTARAGTGRNVDEFNASTEGEWRRSWMLTVTTDLVAEVEMPTQQTTIIRPTVQDAAEPDYEIS